MVALDGDRADQRGARGSGWLDSGPGGAGRGRVGRSRVVRSPKGAAAEQQSIRVARVEHERWRKRHGTVADVGDLMRRRFTGGAAVDALSRRPRVGATEEMSALRFAVEDVRVGLIGCDEPTVAV